MDTVIKELLEYKRLVEQDYNLRTKLENLKGHNDNKILGKYHISLDDYGFTVFSNTLNNTLEGLIPLDDLKQIEKLTGAKLYKLHNFNYAFTW